MKIGILTFHYVTNYGAVLQAYALQRHLEKQGHEVVIIDYRPKSRQKPILKRLLARRLQTALNKITDFRKEVLIERFRKKHLHQTIRYCSLSELQHNPPLCDYYICGSDQIWNIHFTSQGENKSLTGSYFLDFGPNNVRRISYAASFGCTEYPAELRRFTKPALARFHALSVREQTGQEIINKIGFENAEVVPDPTLLLCCDEYRRLLSNTNSRKESKVFIYALHQHQHLMNSVIQKLKQTNETLICGTGSHWAPGIESWLQAIASAKMVVTNSFHGVVFSILFEKNFIAVSVEGSNVGMNDRLHTLLGQLGLESRIMSSDQSLDLDSLLQSKINWETVRPRIEALKKTGDDYLINALSSES